MARKRSSIGEKVADFADSLTLLGLRLGAAAFLLVLGYIIYGLASGSVARAAEFSLDDQMRVYENIALACRLLSISGIVFVLCAAVRYYTEETLGYILSITGTALYLGTPWVFSAFVAESALRSNQAIASIVWTFRVFGMVMFVPGFVLVIRDVLLRITFARLKAEIAKKRREYGISSFIVGEISEEDEDKPPVRRPGIYAKCWQTSYCRDFVRQFCPAYEKRKSCWKIKSGCMCDEGLMLKAMRVKSKEAEFFEKDLRYRHGAVTEGQLTAAQKRKRCRECVIYQFHQQQKYKLVSPLVLPAAVAALYYLFPWFESRFDDAVRFIDKFMSKVSFLPQAAGSMPQQPSVPDIFFWLFFIWLAILIISYSLHFVEWCIFKLQI